MAVKFGINLIIWGENSQDEYGGPEKQPKKKSLHGNGYYNLQVL